MDEKDVVWKSTLDGRYTVTVTRVGPYHGELTVSEGDQFLHREAVGLMYDAKFGPDAADVIDWKRIAMDVVDSHNSSSR